MARIAYPDLSQLSEDVQELAARINPMLNVFRMLAHAESAYYGFMKFGNALLMKSELNPVLREIIILRVGHLSKASYEIYQHEKIARHVGVSSDKIKALGSGENEDVFDYIENIVIRFTDEVVHSVKAHENTFDAISQYLNPRQLNEAILIIGFYMMVCRYLENLEIDIEEEGVVDPTLNFAPD